MHSDIYSIVPTVRVKSEMAPGGHMIMNKSDFDPNVHELFTDQVLPPPPYLPPPPPVTHAALANLPKNWRNEKTAWLRNLAEKVSGRTPEDRDQAIQVIESELTSSQ
jgi:hypothetical protein